MSLWVYLGGVYYIKHESMFRFVGENISVN